MKARPTTRKDWIAFYVRLFNLYGRDSLATMAMWLMFVELSEKEDA